MNLATNTATRLLDFLRGRQDEMVELLTAMVAVESPSHDFASQTPVQDILCDALHERGYTVRRIPGKSSGGQLLAVPENRIQGQPIQLLVGHCDTVWPIGTLREHANSNPGRQIAWSRCLRHEGRVGPSHFCYRSFAGDR